jgi:hypothetical protein
MTDTTPAPRPARDRTLPIVFSVLGVIVVIGILFTLLVPQARFGSDSSRQVQVDEPFEAVAVTTEVADAEVLFRDVEAVEVTFRQHDLSREMDFTAEVVGSTLDVRVTDNGGGWRWPMFGARSPLVTIVLPLAMKGVDISLDSDVGDVSLRGDFGALQLEVTAGDVKLAGSVTTADLSSTVGDITLKLDVVPDGLDVTATTGDLEVTVPNASYRVETHTNVGDVTVDIPNDTSSTTLLRFETTIGDITVES